MGRDITTDRAIAILGCSAKTLQRKKKDGEIKATKKGRTWFFDEDEILSLVEDVKKQQSIYAPSAINKQLKKQDKAEDKIKELEEKRKLANKKDDDDVLTDVGREILTTITDQLKELGTYKEAFNYDIFTAAISYQDFMIYLKLARELDYTDMKPTGESKEHHYLAVAEKHNKRYDKACEKLGLTVGAIQKLKQPEEKEYNPFEEYL